MSNYRRYWRALTKDLNKNLGKQNFKNLKEILSKNKSPSKMILLSSNDLTRKINFCEHELKIHKENQNNVMIGFKTAQLKDLKKQLK